MLTFLFPIGDDNTDRQNTPYVTYALIAINVAVFIFLQLPNDRFTYAFSVVPFEILHNKDLLRPGSLPGPHIVIPQAPGPNPIYLTILTSMFMHGGWAHIGGNMLYLWIFGDNVEDALGHVKFLIFYLLCGVVASLAQVFAAQAAGGLNLYIPSLGASGAIAGVLGGYLLLYPTRSVRVIIGYLGIVAVPAILVIGLWIALQVFSGVGEIVRVTQQTRESGGVAYWAHIGGAVTGLLLVSLFKNPAVAQRAQQRMNTPPGRSFYG